MKSIRNPAILLLLIFGFCQCEKEELFKIPESDKFIYEEGDTLIYIRNDGTIETFIITSYSFSEGIETFDNSGINWGLGGGSGKVKYRKERYDISMQSTDDNWNLYLDLENDTTPCFQIYFIYSANDETNVQSLATSIYKRCGNSSGKYIASNSEIDSKIDTVINSIKYQNVYSFLLSFSRARIYILLKFPQG